MCWIDFTSTSSIYHVHILYAWYRWISHNTSVADCTWSTSPGTWTIADLWPLPRQVASGGGESYLTWEATGDPLLPMFTKGYSGLVMVGAMVNGQCQWTNGWCMSAGDSWPLKPCGCLWHWLGVASSQSTSCTSRESFKQLADWTKGQTHPIPKWTLLSLLKLMIFGEEVRIACHHRRGCHVHPAAAFRERASWRSSGTTAYVPLGSLGEGLVGSKWQGSQPKIQEVVGFEGKSMPLFGYMICSYNFLIRFGQEWGSLKFWAKLPGEQLRFF